MGLFWQWAWSFSSLSAPHQPLIGHWLGCNFQVCLVFRQLTSLCVCPYETSFYKPSLHLHWVNVITVLLQRARNSLQYLVLTYAWHMQELFLVQLAKYIGDFPSTYIVFIHVRKPFVYLMNEAVVACNSRNKR